VVDDAVDMRLKLICFAPEGSPLIGMSYHVGHDGASLGRAKTNGISLMLEDRSIDNSVSQEHARIEMDKVNSTAQHLLVTEHHIHEQHFCVVYVHICIL
jgi:hypothetical protein